MKRAKATIIGNNKWYPIKTNGDLVTLWKWCLDQPSNGHYDYSIYMTEDTVWYFELKEDALMFALKWSAT